ncbi:MAG: hypothetical protein IH874_09130 [Candidatus Dadabacteria bacterium]|nr:hypothetical protein [Candidatus Dadabacteria bacterium]
MGFREEYGDLSLQNAVDAIVVLLKRQGTDIDEKSFTWTVVGALFDSGVIKREDFEHAYHSLVQNKHTGS